VTITLSADHLELDDRTLTVRFASYELPSGVYQLTVLARLVDLNGDALGSDHVVVGGIQNGLFKLSGNFNSDSGVSIFDFPTFAYWFGQPVGIAPSYVDLNSDGGVTIFDFPTFAANFGVGIRFPIELVAFAEPHERESRTARASEANDDAESIPSHETIPIELGQYNRRADQGFVAATRDEQDEQDLENLIELIAQSNLHSVHR